MRRTLARERDTEDPSGGFETSAELRREAKPQRKPDYDDGAPAFDAYDALPSEGYEPLLESDEEWVGEELLVAEPEDVARRHRSWVPIVGGLLVAANTVVLVLNLRALSRLRRRI